MFIPVCNSNLTAKLCSRLSIHVNKKVQGLGRQFTFVIIITARKRSLRRLCFYTCLSVILFTGDRHSPGANTPSRNQTPREHTPPPGADPPLRSACWEIRATSGRYASYWNAYLFCYYFSSTQSLSLHSTTLYDIRNGVMILVLRPESPGGTISLVIFLFTPFPVFTVLNSSCGKVMFLHLSVILFTGWGCLPLGPGVYTPLGRHPPLGRHTPGTHTPGHTPHGQTPPARHPSGQTPPSQTPPQADTPQADKPLGRHPPGQTPPSRHHPADTLRADIPRANTPTGRHPPGQMADINYNFFRKSYRVIQVIRYQLSTKKR